MADDDPERDVLTSLPRTRPVRRSAKRSADAPPERPAAKAPKAPKAAKAAKGPRPAAGRSSSARSRASTSGNGARAGRARATPPPPRRKVPPAGYAAPEPVAGDDRPGAGAQVLTAVQAAGELTQIGLEVARQTLKAALGRLPRP